VGFGEYDTMILQKSLKALAAKTNASSLKFWGKIKGTVLDYFVVEGTVDAGEPVEGGEPMETRGTGVNKFAYWVSNTPNGEWVELPDIKPSQLIAARTIKYTFTGNLDSKIFTNPFYYDSEKIYLRA
jgi:radial spoke head protein 4A